MFWTHSQEGYSNRWCLWRPRLVPHWCADDPDTTDQWTSVAATHGALQVVAQTVFRTWTSTFLVALFVCSPWARCLSPGYSTEIHWNLLWAEHSDRYGRCSAHWKFLRLLWWVIGLVALQEPCLPAFVPWWSPQPYSFLNLSWPVICFT